MLEKLPIEPLMLKFAAFSAAFGVLVSLLGSIVGNAGLANIVLQPILYGLMMALLGSILFLIIKMLSPEVIDEITKINSVASETTENTKDDMLDDFAIGDSEVAQSSDQFSNLSDTEPSDIFKSGPSISGTKKKSRKAQEGEILVEGVPIKDDQELMARTIQDLMDKDED